MHRLAQFEPRLVNAKAIIFDVRGYPSEDVYPVISHLIDKQITSASFHTPQLIYPDFEKSEYKTDSLTITPSTKKYGGKIFFLTDASAMSYAESFLGLVRDFKLGKLVGRATAGTNGNVNFISLPGGYRTSFSGMLVTNNDGSTQHLRGFVPDIWVDSTVEGIKDGRDEILDRAMQEAVK
nr:S41 family peptidase [Hufsiella arboris]